MNKIELAHMIDHTLLSPDATEEQINRLCQEAIEYDFASVCISPCYVKLANKILQNENPKVCTVIGFPHGMNSTKIKVFEAKDSIENGAKEIDLVINRGEFLSGNLDYVSQEIKEVVEVADGNLVKVILESSSLNDDQLDQLSKIALNAGADYIKTSTGFVGDGATVHAVRCMKQAVDELGKGKIKASGGIRTYEQAMLMINAGASRIGASAGVAILKEAE